ncbi:hypothetical protein N2152v2_001211 [Parachlorella kessleri]
MGSQSAEDQGQLQAELSAVEDELAEVEAEIERLLARQQHLIDHRERLQCRLAVEIRAPIADWLGSFPWDGTVAVALQDVFKLRGFRPLQREVINATQQGRDCLCLMPAGGGKSLCYQLPAIMRLPQGQAAVTLVVLGLKAIGIQVASLTSLTSKEEAAEVNQLLDDAKSEFVKEGAGGYADLRLLYCTPEKIVKSKRFLARLEKLYKAGRLKLIAIDEAHCCRQGSSGV